MGEGAILHNFRDDTLNEKLLLCKKKEVMYGISDTEVIHAKMDELIIKELELLGYTKTAATFRAQEKYYS